MKLAFGRLSVVLFDPQRIFRGNDSARFNQIFKVGENAPIRRCRQLAENVHIHTQTRIVSHFTSNQQFI